MDMAVEMERGAVAMAAAWLQIPLEHRPNNRLQPATIDDVPDGVKSMADKLRIQSAEIADLQVRIADLQVKAGQVTLENVALGDLVREVQRHVESGTAIQIGSDWITVHYESHEFEATPDDALDLLDAVGLLSRTVQQ